MFENLHTNGLPEILEYPALGTAALAKLELTKQEHRAKAKIDFFISKTSFTNLVATHFTTKKKSLLSESTP